MQQALSRVSNTPQHSLDSKPALLDFLCQDQANLAVTYSLVICFTGFTARRMIHFKVSLESLCRWHVLHAHWAQEPLSQRCFMLMISMLVFWGDQLDGILIVICKHLPHTLRLGSMLRYYRSKKKKQSIFAQCLYCLLTILI